MLHGTCNCIACRDAMKLDCCLHEEVHAWHSKACSGAARG